MPKYRLYYIRMFYVVLNAQYMISKTQFLWFSKANRHLVLRPFLEKFPKIMPFYVNQSDCHILDNICNTSRIPTPCSYLLILIFFSFLGLEMQEMVPNNSSAYEFFMSQKAYFPYYNMFAVTKHNFEYPTNQKTLYDYHNAFIRIPNIGKSNF